MNKNTEILLVRHGFTPSNNAAWNKQEGIRDVFKRDEYCPLDKEYGIKQAQELGDFLGNYLKGKKVLFVVSPYYRTKQTLKYATEKLDSNMITIIEEPSIREINQGLNYSQPKTIFEDDYEAQLFFDLKKTDNSVAISYMQGESEMDVRRRVKFFADNLKRKKETGEYDEIVVLSHETVNKWIYFWLCGKSLEVKQPTASVILASENPECIFVPNTSVPKGYEVDLNSYKNYFKLMLFHNLIDQNKTIPNFQSFYGSKNPIILEDDSIFIEKKGETLIILPGNNSQKGYFFIDSQLGQDCYFYDKVSTSTYYILEGEGTFEVGGKVFDVFAGDKVVVPNNITFYYYGKMKMIKKMEPNFVAENVVVVKDVDYDSEQVKTK